MRGGVPSPCSSRSFSSLPALRDTAAARRLPTGRLALSSRRRRQHRKSQVRVPRQRESWPGNAPDDPSNKKDRYFRCFREPTKASNFSALAAIVCSGPTALMKYNSFPSGMIAASIRAPLRWTAGAIGPR